MSSTTFAIRLAKTLAVFGIGVMAFLVSFGNITDYYSNYYFVEHVMKMDTTFPKNELMYRSIKTDTFFHIAYIFLIGLECIMTFCCFYGAKNMIQKLKSTAQKFHESKVWSIYGLMLGIIIWFLGFQVIGGEWFAMWQSDKWNGLGSADRIVTFITLSLIMLMIKEE